MLVGLVLWLVILTHKLYARGRNEQQCPFLFQQLSAGVAAVGYAKRALWCPVYVLLANIVAREALGGIGETGVEL